MKCGKILLAAAFFLSVGRALADDYAYLTVSQTGADTSISVSQIDKITFDTTDMIIHLTSGSDQRMPLASLQKMFFATEASAISAVSQSRSSMKVEAGLVRFTMADGERATIYSAKGEQLFTTRRDATFDLRPLPQAVYIVRVGQETHKLTTR